MIEHVQSVPNDSLNIRFVKMDVESTANFLNFAVELLKIKPKCAFIEVKQIFQKLFGSENTSFFDGIFGEMQFMLPKKLIHNE